MFVLKVNKSIIRVLETEPIYGDSKNIYDVTLEFNEDWDGLNKIITFDNEEESKSFMVPDPTSTTVVTKIPWELLTYPGIIRISIAGIKDNLIVLPTQFYILGKVLEGSTTEYPPGTPDPPPTPTIVDQLLALIYGKGDTLRYEDNILYLQSGNKVLSEVGIQNGSFQEIPFLANIMVDNKSYFPEGTNTTYYFDNVSLPYSGNPPYKWFDDDIVQVISTSENLKIYTLTDAIITYTYAEDGYLIFDSETNTLSGKSAYEIAVKDGFNGTEEEWLESLKGSNGITPHIGENGNWFIGETDTGISAKGEKGDKGDTGSDGITPHIGENGNWFIGETDTGLTSKGDKGDKGDPGSSAYQVAVNNGFTGTEEEWLDSLNGKSAYEVAVDNGFTGTEAEWLNSLTMDGVTIKIVNSLPTIGEDRILYFVPKTDRSDNDYYEEWMWINSRWELLGTTKIDLSGYVTTQQLETALQENIPSKVSELENDAGYLTDGALPVGGTAGQILSKSSGTDYDAAWVDPPEGAAYTAGAGISIENGTISNTSRIVPVTLEEYNALSEEEKNREDVYYSVIDASNDFDDGQSGGSGSSSGSNGATFTPSVSPEGVISWTNDGGLANPEPVNIKGPQGEQGIQGSDGITPHIGENGNWFIGETDTGISATGPQGQNATINGVNTLTITAEKGIELAQEQDSLTISTPTWPSNPNLLDNWYFADPINQRGQSSYTTDPSVLVYSIDRWKIWGQYRKTDTLVLNDEYITFKTNRDGGFVQIIESKGLQDRYLNFSMLCRSTVAGSLWLWVVSLDSDGKETPIIDAHRSIATSFSLVSVPATISVPENSETLKIQFLIELNEDVVFDLKAAKLELGDHQTLAHQDASGNWVLNDPPPNKALELAKCQRYYRRDGDCGLMGIVQSRDAVFTFPFPIEMRATPTVSLLKQQMELYCPNNAQTHTISNAAITLFACSNKGNRAIVLSGNFEPQFVADGDAIRYGDLGDLFAFSADL